jgi:hypothetical protein
MNDNTQYPVIAPDGPSEPGITGFSGNYTPTSGTSGAGHGTSQKKVRNKRTNLTPKKKKRK